MSMGRGRGAFLKAVAATVAMLAVFAGAAPAAAADPVRPQLGWSTNTLAGFAATETALGVRPAAVSTYSDFSSPFPADWAAAARERSVPLVLDLEPWNWEHGAGDQPAYSLASIASGAHDVFLRQWARDARDADVAIMLRFAPEMNGDWQPWFINDTPRDFRRAWRHAHTLFAEEGASNVRWVFNPNVHYEGAPPFSAYWPGDRYVDWVALDGYNWRGVLPNRGYEDARTVFGESVRMLRDLSPTAPLMIAEAGSGPLDKERWLASLADAAPRLGARLVVWFEHNKETDWRLSTARLDRPLSDLLKAEGWRVTATG